MEAEVVLRWSVRSDQIDPDRWAKAILAALKSGNPGWRSVGRWWVWPLSVILPFALALSLGTWDVLATVFVPVLLVVGLALGLKFTAPRRVAKQIEEVPALREAFTFVADPTGTSRAGSGGSDQLPWRRYREARLDDDIITLLMDNKTVAVLPVAALDGTHDLGAAVARMNAWIQAAQAEGSTPPSPV